MAEPSGGGTVAPTSRRTLGTAAVVGALVGWLVVVVTGAVGGLPPRIPWSAPIGLVVFGALVGALAWSTHQRLQVRRERMEPHRAVAFLVLGKASALAGALVAGGYLGFALNFVARLEAEAPRDRVIRGAVAVVAGLALAVAGLLLERACRVPESEEDEPGADLR